MHWLWSAIAGVMLLACPAMAQDAGRATAQRVAMRNQLGLLEFCRARGLAEAADVQAARRALARLPAADPGLGDAEETAGRQGVIAFGASLTPLQAAADASGTTLRWRCQDAARIAQALADR